MLSAFCLAYVGTPFVEEMYFYPPMRMGKRGDLEDLNRARAAERTPCPKEFVPLPWVFCCRRPEKYVGLSGKKKSCMYSCRLSVLPFVVNFV